MTRNHLIPDVAYTLIFCTFWLSLVLFVSFGHYVTAFVCAVSIITPIITLIGVLEFVRIPTLIVKKHILRRREEKRTFNLSTKNDEKSVGPLEKIKFAATWDYQACGSTTRTYSLKMGGEKIKMRCDVNNCTKAVWKNEKHIPSGEVKFVVKKYQKPSGESYVEDYVYTIYRPLKQIDPTVIASTEVVVNSIQKIELTLESIRIE